MTPMEKLAALSKQNLNPHELFILNEHPSYWGSRCALELQYATKLSESEGGAFDMLVGEAIDLAWKAHSVDGGITRPVTEAVERALQSIVEKAKEYTLLCIGHSHIDMNWMWGYDETVSITLETFRTVLDLMNEYPAFTFGQSQASVYRIVEKHCPAILEEIKHRVHEGRWEVTASTWVEADRNMPNLESMARHFIYTKQYLSRLLEIDPATLDLDYEPDTFGHSIHVPEVLCDANVKYYYHCRGIDQHTLYNWKAPSGRSLLVFREPSWYNWSIDGRCAIFVPQFCKEHRLDTMLRVYGVGDHGGGPTRRDIERIMDMDRWPIFPHYCFGTYREFYQLAEKNRDAYPEVKGELNFVFDGCYTTQTRQKRGNRLCEAALSEAEGISALAAVVTGTYYDAPGFAGAWKKVLFNQFHDILPGSGVVETREYAMGQYQEAFAVANTNRILALRAISDVSDTSAFTVEEEISTSRSEGAGVGFGLDRGFVAPVGRHAGIRRLFTIFNPLPFAREELTRITVWDWPEDSSRIRWIGANGERLPHQLLSSGANEYWGHRYTEALVKVKLPAMGYTTVFLDVYGDPDFGLVQIGPRINVPSILILENETICAKLDRTGGIISLRDKRTGVEYARPGSLMGVFRLVEEDTSQGMSAWQVGRYKNVETLARNVQIKEVKVGLGLIRQSISYDVSFGHGSKLMVTVSLDEGECMLRFDVKVRWQEIGTTETCFPQLNFFMPVAYPYSLIRYDVPMGVIDRPLLDMDVPAQSFGMPLNENGDSLMLVSDCKYGYRGNKDGISLTLIRSSMDPDPWPEVGGHHIRMAIAISNQGKAQSARMAALICREPIIVSVKAHEGVLPAECPMLKFEGEGIVLSAVKMAEDGSSIVVRYYEAEGNAASGKLEFLKAPKSSQIVNILEQPIEGDTTIVENTVKFSCRPYGVGNLLIGF